jgi:hypothetical protein
MQRPLPCFYWECGALNESQRRIDNLRKSLDESQRIARTLATIVRCNCGDSLTAIEVAAVDAALAYPCGEKEPAAPPTTPTVGPVGPGGNER